MPENYGFARACNLAAEKASMPLLFFLNPDCLLKNDCVSILSQAMGSCAIAGPRVLNPDGSVQLSFGPALSLLTEILQKFRADHEASSWMQNWLQQKTASDFHPDYVSGCALMIHTTLFREMGGFDPKFFLYEEDVDLCRRVRES